MRIHLVKKKRMSKPIIELHPKYKPLITSTVRYSVVSGGRGSSKSFSVATYLVLKTFEKGNVILFSRYTMVSAHLSVIPEFTSKLEDLGIEEFFHITKNEVINKVTGSRIIFRGIKSGSKIQTANLKSIEGLNIFVLDEAEELISEEIFDTIDLSVRVEDRQNKVIVIFNPPTKQHWLYTRWFQSMGVEPGSNTTKGMVNYIHTTYLDNIDNLSEDFIRLMEKMKEEDPAKYDNVVMGGFKDNAEGLIYTNWEIGQFPEDELWECGLDFGYSNSPNALTRVYIDDKRKLIHLDQLLYEGGLKPSLMADKVAKLSKGRLIIADSASPDLIAEIRGKDCGNGKKAKIEPVKKPKIVDRIEMMQDYKFIVSPRSNNIVEELNNYCWDPHYDEGERPTTEFDHALDGISYLVVHRKRTPKVKKFRIR